MKKYHIEDIKYNFTVYADCLMNSTRSTCPADFTYVSSVNGCYKLVSRNRNWNDAGQECRSLHKDANLLVVNDADEQREIAGMLNSTSR